MLIVSSAVGRAEKKIRPVTLILSRHLLWLHYRPYVLIGPEGLLFTPIHKIQLTETGGLSYGN